jgi:hypothetical protein
MNLVKHREQNWSDNERQELEMVMEKVWCATPQTYTPALRFCEANTPSFFPFGDVKEPESRDAALAWRHPAGGGEVR